MSKRDKDKTLRKYVRERSIDSPPDGCISTDAWTAWQSSKHHQLETEDATRLAQSLGIALPEINVDDFKQAGYMPEVLLNYLCLLGWSPGDDIEHFNADFLVERFSLDRIVKSPAKFDRAKLLAFNLDAFQTEYWLPDDAVFYPISFSSYLSGRNTNPAGYKDFTTNTIRLGAGLSASQSNSEGKLATEDVTSEVLPYTHNAGHIVHSAALTGIGTKFISTKSTDEKEATQKAYELQAKYKTEVKAGYTVFDKSFEKVALEYIEHRKQRGKVVMEFDN